MRATLLVTSALSCSAQPMSQSGLPASLVQQTKYLEARFVGSQGPVDLHLETARTPDQLQRGLMGRTSLAAADGMIFIFGHDDDHTFWMRNTPLELDMIFIASDGRIVGVVPNAEPFTDTARHSGVACRYVVEIAAGQAKKLGLMPGGHLLPLGT